MGGHTGWAVFFAPEQGGRFAWPTTLVRDRARRPIEAPRTDKIAGWDRKPRAHGIAAGLEQKQREPQAAPVEYGREGVHSMLYLSSRDACSSGCTPRHQRALQSRVVRKARASTVLYSDREAASLG